MGDILLKNRSSINDSGKFDINKIMMFALVLIGLVIIFSNGMGDVTAAPLNDTHQPIISSTDPLNNAVSVSTTKVVKLIFNEPVKKGNMFIEFKSSNGKLVQFTSKITGKTLYLTPKSQLAHKTTYTITLHSNSIKDVVGNGVKLYSTKFTTIQTTRTYSANGISFNYPSNWHVGTDFQDENICIYGMKGYDQDSPQFQLEIMPNPKGMTDQDAIQSIYNVEFPSGFKILSKHTYTLNGNKVYEMLYTINNKKYYPAIMKNKEINIIKNHKTYIMDFIATLKNYDKEKIDFNIIANSLKIQ